MPEQIILTINEIKWLNHLISCDLPYTSSEWINKARKYVVSGDTAFKRRVKAWLESGMKIEDRDNDCFMYLFEEPELDTEGCGRCSLSDGYDGCREAHKWLISSNLEEVKKRMMKEKAVAKEKGKSKEKGK